MKPISPRLRLLARVAGFPIYLVSGEKVRNELDIDFTQGGNDGIYPLYIPEPEIWIDDALRGLDRTATALHEMVERDLMVCHGMSYDPAHEIASSYERGFRRQLKSAGVTTFDARRLEAAYRGYLRNQAKLAEPKTARHARQIDRDIASSLSGKPR
jgi:hypothetical protein